MKTKREIMAQEPVFLGNVGSQEDVLREFFPDREGQGPAPKGVHILFSVYNCPDYEGFAFVLFKRAGKLYEVNGSHCSCYGLEGQWAPESVDLKALGHRLVNGSWDSYYGQDCCERLKAFIGAA